MLSVWYVSSVGPGGARVARQKTTTVKDDDDDAKDIATTEGNTQRGTCYTPHCDAEHT